MFNRREIMTAAWAAYRAALVSWEQDGERGRRHGARAIAELEATGEVLSAERREAIIAWHVASCQGVRPAFGANLRWSWCVAKASAETDPVAAEIARLRDEAKFTDSPSHWAFVTARADHLEGARAPRAA